ncbi:MAG: hypothetical protein ACE37M_11710 [Henriciella sp.]
MATRVANLTMVWLTLTFGVFAAAHAIRDESNLFLAIAIFVFCGIVSAGVTSVVIYSHRQIEALAKDAATFSSAHDHVPEILSPKLMRSPVPIVWIQPMMMVGSVFGLVFLLWSG